jgi:hypothetical protein
LLPCPTANQLVHSRRLSVCATIASTRDPSNPQKARAFSFAGFPNPIHVSRNTPGFRSLAAPVTVPSPPVRESRMLYLLYRYYQYTYGEAPSHAAPPSCSRYVSRLLTRLLGYSFPRAELEDHKHAGGRQSRTGRRNYGHNTSNDMKRFLIEPHYPQRGCCRSRFLVSLDAPTARA